jgi:hypothetical protein
MDYAFIWAGLIAFAVLAYVVMDGFDLGIGILFPFVKGEKNRDLMMNSVAPVWDGNETWLVLGGGGLFAVFPLAYAIVMPALYIPIIIMLLALVFRGVAFEFPLEDTARAVSVGLGVCRRITDRGFHAGDCAWCAGSWVPGCRTLLCRRGVGLADAIQPDDRHCACDWLCALGRMLAYLQNGRSGAGACVPLCPHHRRRHDGTDWRRQPLDAVP